MADHRERDAAIVADYLAPMSLRAVGAKWGLSQESVRRILQRRGVPTRHSGERTVPRPPPRARALLGRRDPMPCGTHAAYTRHRRLGEEACDACKSAHAEYVRASR